MNEDGNKGIETEPPGISGAESNDGKKNLDQVATTSNNVVNLNEAIGTVDVEEKATDSNLMTVQANPVEAVPSTVSINV